MRSSTIGLLCLAGLAGSAHAATIEWTISKSSPGVTVSRAGTTKPASRGGRVHVGDIVATGPSARAVLVRGEQYAVLAPNSRIQIADPTPSQGLMQIVEQIGNVVFSIKKGGVPHFGVTTPYLAAVVKGTTFSVTVDAESATVQVLEGSVEVATRDGGARELILPGSVATVGAADKGQITIDGKTKKVLHSPFAPSATPLPLSTRPAAAVTSPTANPVASTVSETDVSKIAASDPVSDVQQISVAVEERPESLAALAEA